jgi:uncharacterized protein involved in outer membrane biogenesis
VIRFVFRWAFRFLLLAIVLVIGLLLLKDTLARSFAEQQVRRSSGFDTKIGKLQLAVIEPRLSIDNLVLYNPPQFGGSRFLDAPEIQVEYAPGALATGRIHFKFLRLNVRELNIVTSQGKTNIAELLHSVSPESASSNSTGRAERYRFAGIDLLNLSIGRIRYTDLERPKRNQDIQLGLEGYLVRNVQSEEDLASILLKLLFRAGITVYVDEHRAPAARNPEALNAASKRR